MQSKYQKGLSDALSRAQEECKSNPNFTSSSVSFDSIVEKFEPPKRFYHDAGNSCYFQYRSLFWSTPDKILRNLFMRGVFTLYDVQPLLIFGSLYLLLALITYNILLPTDLVLQNLIFGATMGRAFGLLVNLIKAKYGYKLMDPGAFALLGAVSFWSGTSRLLLTVALVSIESTLDLSLLPGIIIVILTSISIGNVLGHSQYHMELHVRHIPFLPFDGDILRTLSVRELMEKKPVYLHETETLERIRTVLDKYQHHGFPVIRELGAHNSDVKDNIVVGIILRKQLKLISKNVPKVSDNGRQRSTSDGSVGSWASNETHVPTVDVEQADPDSFYCVEDGEIRISIGKAMSSPPITVQESMSAHKAYQIFRHCVLRHLCVTDACGSLTGILTRKDFEHALH
jgi:CBS domain-containing protein